jgi:hypothetical protein
MRIVILTIAALALVFSCGVEAMESADETAIQQLLDSLTAARNCADAKAFSVRYQVDGTFTNVNGTLYLGRDGWTSMMRWRVRPVTGPVCSSRRSGGQIGCGA